MREIVRAAMRMLHQELEELRSRLRTRVDFVDGEGNRVTGWVIVF
jgi:hypothetical protein